MQQAMTVLLPGVTKWCESGQRLVIPQSSIRYASLTA